MLPSSSNIEAPAAQHQYWSVDSAPARLTRSVSPLAAPAVLVIFTIVSAALVYLVNRVPAMIALFPNGDLLVSPYTGTHAIPLRIFIISFYVAFAMVVGASWWRRVLFLVDMSLYFVLLCALLDVMNIIAYQTTGFVYSLAVVEILSGLIGFFVFSLCLLNHGSMPARVPAPYSKKFKFGSLVRIVVAVILSMFGSVAVGRLHLPLISDLRQISLLGGTGPGVFLFLPMLFLLLYIAGTLQSMLRRKSDFMPNVTVIIPAHNEAHVIARTLAAVDAAAAPYAGDVTVLVLNNCSTDDTVAVAQAALAGLVNLRGRVVDVPEPGKSLALNRGIAETQTEFVVRIDADTQILPETLMRAMRHFSRDEVGVVGGLPLAPGGGLFDRSRMLEVLLKHGFYQVAYGAIDGIVGVPGMFAVYRTELVRQVGGFVQGMNGEDTDVSLRIGELGHRVVGDPSVIYVSEVPLTYRHMREQRMRWFRSVYHVSARNRDYLDNWRFSVRGKIVLPFMLLNSARRAMTLPLAIFGAMYLSMDVEMVGTVTVQAAIAVLMGAPILVGAFAALANGRPKALLGLPEYFLFRIVRCYLTLESVLSIAFEPRPVRMINKMPSIPVAGNAP